MNAALDLLLSKLYDGALAPDHRVDLQKSSLTDDTIRAHFIRSVPPAMIRPLLGFDLPEIRSALLFPFRSPAGGFLDHVRLKVFPMLTDAAGHTMKYLGPKGAAPRLYFTIWSLPILEDSTVPLWLVEGSKKGLAVGQLGLPAVAFEGIEAWHSRGFQQLLPDFDGIALRGRTIELLPDGDWQHNGAVERGVRRFASALALRGARPRLVVLPDHLEAAS